MRPIHLLDIDIDLSQYIDGYLTIKYNLDTTTREKPVMNVDDVYLVLHHHWVLDISVFPGRTTEATGSSLTSSLRVHSYQACCASVHDDQPEETKGALHWMGERRLRRR